jgi:ankyrin repeat protein
LIDFFSRWGRTPLDDAISSKHQDVVELLLKSGAIKSNSQTPLPSPNTNENTTNSNTNENTTNSNTNENTTNSNT